MDTLTGKAALVTGGASGIGSGIAAALAAAGARIVLGDIDAVALRLAAARLADRGADVLAVELDVSRPDGWRAAVDLARARFGGIDILCNNAGVGPAAGPNGEAIGLLDTPEAVWRLGLDTNVTGVFLGVRAVAPLMIAGGRGGHIVNTASMAGLFAPPGMVPYACSKFAVVAMSEGLRAELAPHGVGVTVLCPGAVESNLAATSAGRRSSVEPASVTPETAPAHAPSGQPMRASSVGERVVAAILANEMYVLTHPEYQPHIEDRSAAIRSAIGVSAEPGHVDPDALLRRSRNPAYAEAVAARRSDQRR